MTDPIDATVASVSSLLDQIKKTGLNSEPHAHVRVWFRGQKDNSWDLVPGIYRASIPVTSESGRLELERHLTQDFQVESAGLLSGRESKGELYFLQQHYGLPTRLLDWTHRPLAALFFAIADPAVDGGIFMIDAYHLATTQRATDQFRGIATSRAPFFAQEIDAIYNWADRRPTPFIIPVRPDHFDTRIAHQQSCFTFHSQAEKILRKQHVNRFWKFSIPRTAKQAIREELFQLGMDDFAVYGDLPSLAQRLKSGWKIP
jgi:hypothetical protein